MKRYLYFMIVAAIAVASCAKETLKDESKTIVAPEIVASQENQPEAKTILNVNEGVGTIYWKPAENINVFYGTTNVLYTSKNKENVTVASFKTTEIIGATEDASTNIWGLYPYDEDAVCNGNKVTTTIASTQYGVPETFDDNLFTTLAHSETRELRFFNVCGGIKFSLSRDDITKITFEGNNGEILAGKVDLTFVDNVPAATPVTSNTKITLFPKAGSTFNKNINYYVVTLPASLTGGFKMKFYTETQIGTFNYTEKTVSLTRSKFGKKEHIDIYASFVDRVTIDLSKDGSANSYIVSEEGDYKFKAVKGNSDESVGDVKGVKVLWETFGTDVTPSVGDLIKTEVSYSDNYITFSTNDTYKEGNAVIAAYSDSDCTDGNVLWSWHIWLTDQPEPQVYNNNAGTMMDRNLGATSSTPGDVHALGLHYQWGRKDPFLFGSSITSCQVASSTLSWPSSVKSNSSTGTIAYAVANPTTFITYNSSNYDWYYSTSLENTRWQNSKTVYDPCPTGWRVPSSYIWSDAFGSSSFESGPIDNTNKGMNFGSANGQILSHQLGSAPIIWYPFVGYVYEGGGRLYITGDYGYYWSTTGNECYPYSFAREFAIDYNGGVYTGSANPRAAGNAVRCMKEN